jgi:NTP pyrophosphatase (non-canonical NTP hydrolase)
VEKLKDIIRKPEFNPEDYGGIMIDEFQFIRYFFFENNSVEDCFSQINVFLSDNGYDKLDFGKFQKSEDACIEQDGLTIFEGPYISENSRQLTLVIMKYNPLENPIDELMLDLVRFRNERDWSKFHNPKDLAIALNIESSELLEVFLWNDPDNADRGKVKEELADVFAYGLLLAEKYGFDVKEIVQEKINKNSLKYPVEKAKGSSKKYDEL